MTALDGGIAKLYGMVYSNTPGLVELSCMLWVCAQVSLGMDNTCTVLESNMERGHTWARPCMWAGHLRRQAGCLLQAQQLLGYVIDRLQTSDVVFKTNCVTIVKCPNRL